MNVEVNARRAGSQPLHEQHQVVPAGCPRPRFSPPWLTLILGMSR
jgi:hypothetical protein